MPRKGFKLVLLGDASVGKSSILLRFLHNKFSEEIAACHEKPNFSMYMFFFTYHKDHLSCKFSVFHCLFVCGFQETTVGAAFNTKTIESRGRQVGHGVDAVAS